MVSERGAASRRYCKCPGAGPILPEACQGNQQITKARRPPFHPLRRTFRGGGSGRRHRRKRRDAALWYHSGGPVSRAGGASFPKRITFISMNLRSLFSLFSSDLAIDLGTANTLVFAKTNCTVDL